MSTNRTPPDYAEALAAVVVGALLGALTYFSAGNTSGALLAGVTGMGISALVLRKLISL
ncbi:hypothetical protein ACH492_39940 [Streptomyces sp. NPDC019443]|uniref:hypothetical protein n=1 Tax=Streptomyces sp. NPDC019443 TaxID=3365061 RepID=UPI0037B2F707